MPGREFEADPHTAGVTFRSPRNWTAVMFFGALGVLHLSIAATSLIAYRWEAHMSVVFGAIFGVVALACVLTRQEIAILPNERRVVVRTGFRRLSVSRVAPFANITSVRVTLLGRDQGESSVAIVCKHEDIELPPTRTPRQEALLLAMLIDVRLVKVYGDGPPPEPAQRIAKLYRNEDAI
jgi:hypothetical protein